MPRGSAWCVLALVLTAYGCRKDVEPFGHAAADLPFVVELPPGAPPLPAFEDALTEAKVRLGKALFFDQRLSQGKGISCASCHHPGKAFSDTVALSVGAFGRLGFRNAPTLTNVAYHPLMNRDGGVPTLHQQVLVPISDEAEMDADIHQVAVALRDLPPYAELSERAYGRRLDIFVITRALAAYERTLIGGWSRYDLYRQGDTDALTPQEQDGLAVFEGAGCGACHGGFDLTDRGFHNTGLELDHSDDAGRERITLDPLDRGKFKTPTLRNIALTAPYMHDGSLATLEEVVAHFNGGGLPDPNRSPLMVPLGLTAQQQQDLVAFFGSLTDGRSLDQVP